MNSITTNDLSFLEWAKHVSTQYPDILKHMKKSTDPLDRVIAKRIIQIAGVDTNA